MTILLKLQYPVCTLSVYSFTKENKVTIRPKLRELIILQNNGRSQCIMSVNEFSESVLFFSSRLLSMGQFNSVLDPHVGRGLEGPGPP